MSDTTPTAVAAPPTAPMLFGRPMIPTSTGWIASYAELYAAIQRAGATFDAYIGDTAVACAESLECCTLQLQVELRRIWAALDEELR